GGDRKSLCDRRGAVARSELPAPVAADSDRDDVVALRVEELEHRPSRRERDVVLARTPAGEDGDAEAPAHGGGPGCCPCCDSFPTTIVTTVPGGACVPPGGSCESTIPSCDWSVTGCVTMCTLNPEAVSCCCADAWSWLVTSGTADVFGPFETLSVIVEPGLTEVPGPGDWSTTVS